MLKEQREELEAIMAQLSTFGKAKLSVEQQYILRNTYTRLFTLSRSK